MDARVHLQVCIAWIVRREDLSELRSVVPTEVRAGGMAVVAAIGLVVRGYCWSIQAV